MTPTSETRRRRRVSAFGRSGVVLALVLVTACSANASSSDTKITVFAAASLNRAFTEEAAAYDKAHDHTDVVLSFAGSQSLVAQIQQGAPADVLATADTATISTVSKGYQVFAHNQLAIVTAPGNPLHLTSLADLARKDLKVVLAGPTVPVGKAAAKALTKAGVVVHPVSLEDAVSGVVGKVRLGEADAGIAYVTDLGNGVAGVPLAGTRTDLAITALHARGSAFVEFVGSAAGQAILARYRFQ
jgi:molybdate transport system substrate-binding protein